MKPMLVLAALCLPGVALAACPEPPDHSDRLAQLFNQAQAAPDARSGQLVSNRMWALWAEAPDDHAQQLLNTGMQMRAGFALADAVEVFDELVAYCPDYAEGYNQRAFANFIRGDYAAALADLERTLELSPTHVAAKAGLALTHMGLGDMDRAQRLLREALALNPWLPERRMLTEPADQQL